MPILRPFAALVLVAATFVACGADPAPAPPSGPIALPSPSRQARTIPLPDGSIRIEAVSSRVSPGQPYQYAAFTHCGFTANTFDFDGSFWTIVDAPAAFGAELNGGNPPAGIDNPSDEGLIVLIGPDRATWTARRGAVLQLARGPSEVKVFGCD